VYHYTPASSGVHETGVLVAFGNRGDAHHTWAVSLAEQLLTCAQRASVMRAFPLQLTYQPGLDRAPLPLGRGLGHAKHFRRFFQRAAPKRAHFDQMRKTRIELLQPPNDVVQHKNRNLIRRRRVQGLVHRHPFVSLAAFVRMAPARVVDEEPPHDLTRHTVEVCPVSPVDAPIADQFHVGLVDQRSRLKGVARAFPSQLARGNAAQLVVDEGQQSVERSPVTSRPVDEQPGDVAGGRLSPC
jgi:hypothetical protein